MAILRELVEGECQWDVMWETEEGGGEVERKYILRCHEVQTYFLKVTITRFAGSQPARTALDQLLVDLPVDCFHGYHAKYNYAKDRREVRSEHDWQADRWLVTVSDWNDTFVHSRDVSEKIYRGAVRVGLFPPGECAALTPATGIALPNGVYPCQGYEYGLLASIGMVTFNPDGSFLDQAFYYPPSPGTAGEWYYDSAAQRILFSENLDFAYAEYNLAEDAATLHFRKGIVRAHAEGGVIRCFKSELDAG